MGINSYQQGLSLKKEIQNLLISKEITLLFSRINLVKGIL
jgi:hypothetical protein